MTFKPWRESAQQAYRVASSDSPDPTGVSVIERQTQGSPGFGELVMVLTRIDIGKTSIGATPRTQRCRHPDQMFFSLEMASGLLLRMAAINTNTPTYVSGAAVALPGPLTTVDSTVEQLLLSIDDPAMSIKGMGNYLDAAEEGGADNQLKLILDLELIKAPLGTGEGVATVDTVSRRPPRTSPGNVTALWWCCTSFRWAPRSRRKRHRAARATRVDRGHLSVGRLDAKFGGDSSRLHPQRLPPGARPGAGAQRPCGARRRHQGAVPQEPWRVRVGLLGRGVPLRPADRAGSANRRCSGRCCWSWNCSSTTTTTPATNSGPIMEMSAFCNVCGELEGVIVTEYEGYGTTGWMALPFFAIALEMGQADRGRGRLGCRCRLGRAEHDRRRGRVLELFANEKISMDDIKRILGKRMTEDYEVDVSRDDPGDQETISMWDLLDRAESTASASTTG